MLVTVCPFRNPTAIFSQVRLEFCTKPCLYSLSRKSLSTQPTLGTKNHLWLHKLYIVNTLWGTVCEMRNLQLPNVTHCSRRDSGFCQFCEEHLLKHCIGIFQKVWPGALYFVSKGSHIWNFNSGWLNDQQFINVPAMLILHYFQISYLAKTKLFRSIEQ